VIPASAGLGTQFTATLGRNLLQPAFACSSLGNCWLGGSDVSPTGRTVGVVAQQVGGVWLRATTGVGVSSSDIGSTVDRMACPSITLCVVSGSADMKDGRNGLFVEAEVRGIWQRPVLSFYPKEDNAFDDAASCASPTDCFVVGNVQSEGGTDSYQPFGEQFVNFEWGPLESSNLGGLEYDGAGFSSISCSPGGCWAVGTLGEGQHHEVGFTYLIPTPRS
jgi:hypothetical protein